ncbi:hypothetical protein CONCODRAFT_79071 [Conidiobolus coronatus NRRL 28638]|uniref:Protein YAE1 n=1 Tax=Conidiobolus coronatus (strain ATCC 28846 / CBS 209.66 / NRRL 28638) TaxID=796925 RepID=A0A137P4T2_CONC2|nr:hypothetical protein CONCODRAFT_79071 [Conidiobolus coronatus NRRL 28638]|eukprot:KXN69959.1 hypothetical protein CONCODRAFT_79071 [Conidiobolus coronatus NRRL 28638]
MTSEDNLSSYSDDIFIEDDIENSDYESRLHSNLMNQLKINFEKEGFREGILTTKDKFVQGGFDQGFEEGLNFGGLSGQLMGASWALKHLKLLEEADAESLCNQVQELDFEELIDKEYFKSHPVGESEANDNFRGWKELLPDINLSETQENQYYFKEWYTKCRADINQKMNDVNAQ